MRRTKRERKTSQLNMRVTPAFHRTVEAMAHERGVSVVELIEAAVKQFGEREPVVIDLRDVVPL